MNDGQENNGGKKIKKSLELDRTMRTPGITALGVGAMIGAGIFVLTGMAAGEAGPALILAFALNGMIALIVGACYAELATMMPKAGGAYIWAKTGLGSFFGFFAGWLSSFAQLVACSLYASAFDSFARSFLYEITGQGLPSFSENFFSLGLLILLLWVNVRGAGNTGRLAIIITGLKVAILLIVAGFGLHVVLFNTRDLSAFRPFFPQGFGGLISAMGITFVAFEGYEIIVQSGEEAKKPGKTIPRAILMSIVIAVFLYILMAVVMIGAVTTPDGQPVYKYLGHLKELGLMEAAGQFVPHGKIVLLIAGLASTASALNATIYGSSRIAFAMGRDNDLPPILGHVHKKRKTPYMAIFVTGLLMAIMTMALPIEDIAASTNIMFLLVFIMVCTTVIRLRSRRPERERPFKIPLSPWLPGIGIIAGVILSVWLLQISLVAWFVALVWTISGGVLYWYQQHYSNRVT
ncbi:MAG: APC family permease [Desulfobacterales bacterium]|nr:APC family permease [Desulfobacterales bacterium]